MFSQRIKMEVLWYTWHRHNLCDKSLLFDLAIWSVDIFHTYLYAVVNGTSVLYCLEQFYLELYDDIFQGQTNIKSRLTNHVLFYIKVNKNFNKVCLVKL